MRQRSRVFEHLAEVSTIKQPIARRAQNEVLSFVHGLLAHALSDDFAPFDGHAPDIRRDVEPR
jgi:hypothetical protein